MFACTADKKSQACNCETFGGVDCSRRKLKEVPAGIPPDTSTLNLDHNEIAYLPSNIFAHLASLKILYLNNNKITELLGPSSALANLKITTLHLESNQIASVDNKFFAPVRNHLLRLYIQTNSLTAFPALSLSALEYLDISSNPMISNLQKHHFEGLPLLYSLTMASCGVASLGDNTFSAARKLQNVNLSRNKLKTMTAKSLAGAVKLKRLDLQNNNIGILSKGWFPEQNSMWCELSMAGNPSTCSILGLESMQCTSSANLPSPVCHCDDGLGGKGSDTSFCISSTSTASTAATFVTSAATKPASVKTPAKRTTNSLSTASPIEVKSTLPAPTSTRLKKNPPTSANPTKVLEKRSSRSSSDSGALVGAVVAGVVILILAITVGILLARQKKMGNAPKVITVINPMAKNTEKESWRQSVFHENAIYGGGQEEDKGKDEDFYASIQTIQGLSPGGSIGLDSGATVHSNETYSSTAVGSVHSDLLLAMAGDGGSLQVYNIDKDCFEKGTQLSPNHRLSCATNSVGQSKDIVAVACDDYDESIIVCNCRSRETMHKFMGHRGSVTSLAFSPTRINGCSLLATSSDDQVVRMWDVSNGQLVNDLALQHTSGVNQVGWSCDGCTLASASNDGALLLWSPCHWAQDFIVFDFAQTPEAC